MLQIYDVGSKNKSQKCEWNPINCFQTIYANYHMIQSMWLFEVNQGKTLHLKYLAKDPVLF